MNRQEVLQGLEHAVSLFKQQEALNQEYRRVKQQDRPYEKKYKIGWLGIGVLGLEIAYMGPLVFLPFAILLSGDTTELETSIVLSLVSAAVITTTYLLFRMYNIKRNKWVVKENKKITELKKAIAKRLKELQEESAEAQKRTDRYLGDWYPKGYERSQIAAFFYEMIENGRARTLGDAINLYEEECYRQRESEERAQIINELERQSFKQNVQIAQSAAETAALSAQLANANKQLVDTNKQLANMERELAELRKENARRR